MMDKHLDAYFFQEDIQTKHGERMLYVLAIIEMQTQTLMR